MTTRRSTPTASSAAATRSSPCAKRLPSRLQAQASGLRAWRVDLRGLRRQAAGGQVALPDRRVLACEPVDRGQSAAHPDPSGDRPLEEALPATRFGRAGERPPQERVGLAAAAGPAHRAGPAARRPDHPGPARHRARQGPRGAADRVERPCPEKALTLGLTHARGHRQQAVPTGSGQDQRGGPERCPANPRPPTRNRSTR